MSASHLETNEIMCDHLNLASPVPRMQIKATRERRPPPSVSTVKQYRCLNHSGWYRAFDELSFGDFAQESSAFFIVLKIAKMSPWRLDLFERQRHGT